MGEDSPESLGWQKWLPVAGSSSLPKRWATLVVTTATDLPEPCVTAPQTHPNSLRTSANTNKRFVSPLTYRCVCTAVHFKLASFSTPLRTRHEERMLSETALASSLVSYSFISHTVLSRP